ncbi:hypothetical protein F4212_05490 [Candidatus Poribacteria bacterium]|nr:hypothetical protein [Gammaproteobacteria bacterium]MYF98576.1 hypothetical protein [Candidatus Poribacteria bacterium]
MKLLRYLALLGIIISATTTGQELSEYMEDCEDLGRSTKKYMACLDLVANDPTWIETNLADWKVKFVRRHEEEAGLREEARLREKAIRKRKEEASWYASQVVQSRESYERSHLAFALLVNDGGAGHWAADVRANTWWVGTLMVSNFEEWEKAVNEERDFRESAGLDNSQYDRNTRNLENAKRAYPRLMEKARDQAEEAGYDAP